jgi:hypothetical protein
MRTNTVSRLCVNFILFVQRTCKNQNYSYTIFLTAIRAASTVSVPPPTPWVRL